MVDIFGIIVCHINPDMYNFSHYLVAIHPMFKFHKTLRCDK